MTPVCDSGSIVGQQQSVTAKPSLDFVRKLNQMEHQDKYYGKVPADFKKLQERDLLAWNRAIKNRWTRSGSLKIPKIRDSQCKDCKAPAYTYWYPRDVLLEYLTQVFPVCYGCYCLRTCKTDPILSLVYNKLDDRLMGVYMIVEEHIAPHRKENTSQLAAIFRKKAKYLVDAGLCEISREGNHLRYRKRIVLPKSGEQNYPVPAEKVHLGKSPGGSQTLLADLKYILRWFGLDRLGDRQMELLGAILSKIIASGLTPEEAKKEIVDEGWEEVSELFSAEEE